MAKFCLNVFTNCDDPKRHDEFNAWYSRVHLPDLSKSDGFVTARRFINRGSGPDDALYYAQYEFDHEDPGRAVLSFLETALKAYKAGRHIDCIVDSQAGPGALWEEISIDKTVAIDEETMDYPKMPSDGILIAIKAMQDRFK